MFARTFKQVQAEKFPLELKVFRSYGTANWKIQKQRINKTIIPLALNRFEFCLYFDALFGEQKSLRNSGKISYAISKLSRLGLSSRTLEYVIIPNVTKWDTYDDYKITAIEIYGKANLQIKLKETCKLKIEKFRIYFTFSII